MATIQPRHIEVELFLARTIFSECQRQGKSEDTCMEMRSFSLRIKALEEQLAEEFLGEGAEFLKVREGELA